MDWHQTISICGTIFAGLGVLIWMVIRLDSDVKLNSQDIKKQGDRIDTLIYAFMQFQRDTDKLIGECQKDIASLEKIAPEFRKKK